MNRFKTRNNTTVLPLSRENEKVVVPSLFCRFLKGVCVIFGVLSFSCFVYLCSLHLKSFPVPTSFGATVSNLIIDDHAPPSWFYHFNPSMVEIPFNVTVPGSNGDKNGRYLLALRECNNHDCPNVFSWLNPLRFGEYYSNVIFAVSEKNDRGFRLCGSLKNPEDVDGYHYHGLDDPRLLVHKQTESSPGEIMVVSYRAPCLYISRLEFSGNNDVCNVKEISRQCLSVSGQIERRREKNWMYLPIPNKHPLFLRDMQTMHVVEVDPSTGIATTVHKAPFELNGLPVLRGSTNFIQHPNDPNKFLGIVHSTYHQSTFFTVNVYKTRFVEVTRDPLKNTFSLTGFSDEFVLPPETKADKTYRIEYPMSWFLNEKNGIRQVVIAMGHMYCESRIVRIPFDAVVRSIHSQRRD